MSTDNKPVLPLSLRTSPWCGFVDCVQHLRYSVLDATGRTVLAGEPPDDEDDGLARRIVASVNLLSSFSVEHLEEAAAHPLVLAELAEDLAMGSRPPAVGCPGCGERMREVTQVGGTHKILCCPFCGHTVDPLEVKGVGA